MVRWGWGSSTINKPLHQNQAKKKRVVVRTESEEEQVIVDFKAIIAEFLGVSFLVLFTAGSAVANGWDETGLLVSFALGLSIICISYAIYHHSGAQLNPAITLCVLIKGEVGVLQALGNAFAQFSGSVCGALILWGMFPCRGDFTVTLGSNVIKHAYGSTHAFLAEFVASTMICFVYLETIMGSRFRKFRSNGFLAVGFTYFAASLALYVIDKGALNPVRAFGPAVISKARDCDSYTGGAIEDLWVLLIAPFIGALGGYLFHYLLCKEKGSHNHDAEMDDVSESHRRPSSPTSSHMREIEDVTLEERSLSYPGSMEEEHSRV